ncbi:hypothetical protein [Helicobacter sp. T3_23-1056]
MDLSTIRLAIQNHALIACNDIENSHNDKKIDCHEFASANSRNDSVANFFNDRISASIVDWHISYSTSIAEGAFNLALKSSLRESAILLKVADSWQSTMQNKQNRLPRSFDSKESKLLAMTIKIPPPLRRGFGGWVDLSLREFATLSLKVTLPSLREFALANSWQSTLLIL